MRPDRTIPTDVAAYVRELASELAGMCRDARLRDLRSILLMAEAQAIFDARGR